MERFLLFLVLPHLVQGSLESFNKFEERTSYGSHGIGSWNVENHTFVGVECKIVFYKKKFRSPTPKRAHCLSCKNGCFLTKHGIKHAFFVYFLHFRKLYLCFVLCLLRIYQPFLHISTQKNNNTNIKILAVRHCQWFER